MPRVSIIINVYNGEATLRETLESVFAQTISDWELIIWDDCSNDATAELISELSDPRLQLFTSSQNRGLGSSRKAALAQATGNWIAYVDQDDLWLPNKLAIQIAAAEKDPELGFVYGRAVRFCPDGAMIDYDHCHEFRPLPEGDIFEELFVNSCFIAMSTVLFRRSALTAAVAAIPDYIDTCPDYFMYLAISRLYNVAAVQDVVCRYRVHSRNMTHTIGQRMQREILSLIDYWSETLPPDLVTRRRKIHSTVLAIHQMRSANGVGRGIRTLFHDGALLYLLSRPIARGYRSLRRRLRTPYWCRQQSAGATAT